MSRAKAQVSRLMALTPYLRARPEGVPLTELAEDFDVSAAQLRKDLQVLVMCGLPELLPDDLIDIDLDAFADDPDGIVRIRNADFMPRPTRLSTGEAASLLVSLESLRDGGEADAVIDRIKSKIELATAEGSRGAVEVIASTATEDRSDLVETFTRAVAEDRQVTLEHLSLSRDEVTTRDVDPLGIHRADGVDYLDAWCHRARQRRLFRLDRVLSVVPLPAGRAHGDLPARPVDEPAYVPDLTHPAARLHLDRPARWIAGYHPVDEASEGSDGALEVVMPVSDPAWLVRLVLSQAPHVRVLEPPQYAALVDEAVQQALAAYHVSQ